MDTVTLKNLAAALDLSPSTVSRALRDSHEISQATKDRVKALAAKLGFQPNPHASSLRRNKSKTIAVIVPEIQNNFFSGVLEGVEAMARNKEFHVLIYLTHEDEAREKSILQLLRNGKVDGIMISVSNTTTSFGHLDTYQQAGIPLVFFDRVNETTKAPRVTTDDEDAAFKATIHLYKAGCRKIACISMAHSLSITIHRKGGYMRALEKCGLVYDDTRAIECGSNDEMNRQKIAELMNSAQRPDGIFCAVERFAVNTYEVCQQLHIQIPKELKIISFSNLTAAALFDPPLSTVVQPAYEIGYKAAETLFKIIEQKKLKPSEKKVVIPSKIVERRSTGK
jgi:LacI family transcriptional regulator, galactose operon repressor